MCNEGRHYWIRISEFDSVLCRRKGLALRGTRYQCRNCNKAKTVTFGYSRVCDMLKLRLVHAKEELAYVEKCLEEARREYQHELDVRDKYR